MIESVGFESEKELDETRSKIARRRSVFASDAGLDHLVELVESAGIFSAIDVGDVVQMANRNYVISILESLGLVEKARLRDLMAYMLEQPILEGYSAKES